jgi:hypothetical protein
MVCASKTIGSRIVGGFVLLNVGVLMSAWRACRSAPLTTADFRTWLACHELKARRCKAEDDEPGVPFKGVPSKVVPSYRVAELAKLLDVTERRARASVNRLVEAGLIEWSAEAISFPDHLRDVPKMVDEAGLSPDPNVVTDDIKNSIGGGKGSVAIPRRILRFLAAGARPALIATVLGLILRCLSRRKAGFGGRGRVKASWIARTFGISIPAVKVARRELVALGWITAEDSGQWAMNRWGRCYHIDLGWQAPTPGDGVGNISTPGETGKGEPDTPFPTHRQGGIIPPLPGATSIPPRPVPGATSIPPDLQTGNPSGRVENQEPAGGPTGFSIKGQGKEDQPPTGPLPPPKLADVRLEDLKDTGRLLDLYHQAVAKGLVGTAEADRLKFIAAAEHALAIASNAPALFAWLVLRGCWRYITGADEDRANARIKAHLRGPDPAPIPSPPRVSVVTTPLATSIPPRVGTECRPLPSSRSIEPGGLSEDARIVKAIREATIRAGIFRDPWPAFQARYLEWTRERWDRGLRELGL